MFVGTFRRSAGKAWCASYLLDGLVYDLLNHLQTSQSLKLCDRIVDVGFDLFRNDRLGAGCKFGCRIATDGFAAARRSLLVLAMTG